MFDPAKVNPSVSAGSIPGARRAAGLFMIAQDLELVRDICVRVESLEPRGGLDEVLLQALHRAVIVSYARPFVGRRGTRLSEDDVRKAFPDEEDALTIHRHYLGLRHKHVAHADSSAEVARPGLLLSMDRQSVEGVQILSMTLVGEPGTFSNLRLLAGGLLTHVQEQFDLAEARILDQAKLLSPEELAALGPSGLRVGEIPED